MTRQDPAAREELDGVGTSEPATDQWDRYQALVRDRPLRLRERDEEVVRLTAEAVRVARERAGISRSGLARAVGIDASELERVERGRKSLTLVELIAIAQATSTSVVELVGGIERAEYERMSGGQRSKWRPDRVDAVGCLRASESQDILVAFGCVLHRHRRRTRAMHCVARDAGVSDDTVRRIERGVATKVTVPTVVRVADACGTTLAELFEAATDLLLGLAVGGLLGAGRPDERTLASDFSAVQLASMLREIPTRVTAVLVERPEEDLPSSDERAAAVIGHVADMLDRWRQRVLRIMREQKRPCLELCDRDEALVAEGYARMDLGVLLASVVEESARFASVVEPLDEDVLRRKGHHPEYGLITVRECVTLTVASVVEQLTRITQR